MLWPDTTNEPYKQALQGAASGDRANNISAIVQYSLEGGAKFLWMGDLETDFMEKLGTVPVGKADVLFAPHHGRDSGRVPAEWLEKISPKIIVVGEAPSQYLNYYPGYNKITQNSAGDIIFDCDGAKLHVYVSDAEYWVDFLSDQKMSRADAYYIGTLWV